MSLIPQATKQSFESARYFSKLIDEKKALFEPFIFLPARYVFLDKNEINTLICVRDCPLYNIY